MAWKYTGTLRPPFAEFPVGGQESVWDYPRTPIIEQDSRLVVVKLDDLVIAESSRAVRVLETASPPTFYLHADDVQTDLLIQEEGSTYCEWKGMALYFGIRSRDQIVHRAGWFYPRPKAPFEELATYVSFYPAKLDCFVAGERVRPQPGGYYGGWLTSEIAGPVKGAPGSANW